MIAGNLLGQCWGWVDTMTKSLSKMKKQDCIQGTTKNSTGHWSDPNNRARWTFVSRFYTERFSGERVADAYIRYIHVLVSISKVNVPTYICPWCEIFQLKKEGIRPKKSGNYAKNVTMSEWVTTLLSGLHTVTDSEWDSNDCPIQNQASEWGRVRKLPQFPPA